MLKLQLKLGEKVAELISQHNALAMVVSQALGGTENTPSSPGDGNVKDLAAGYSSAEDAVAAINQQMLI